MRNSPLTKQVFFSLLFANSLFGQAANKPTTPDSKLLDELVVNAQKEKTKLYENKNFGGTRLDVPLLEVPQSIRVITKQQLKDITAVRMKDTFDYVSGVSQQNDLGGGLWENYAVRGFTGDSNNAGLAYLLNGFQSNRGFNAPRDTANVESIEFLKGPSAALFGGSDPGGTINVVTKKPLWESYNSVQSLVGSYNFMRHTLDSTGPLSDSFAYRFNYAYEDANSFRDFVGNNRSFYSLATTWKINESTTLDYSGEYLDALSDFDRGVFAINNVLGLVPRDRFFGEPNDAPMENQNHTSQLRLTHELNEDWFIRLGTAYKTNSLYGFASETRDINAAAGTMRRRYRLRDYDSDDVTLQAEISGKITNGNLEHNILAGADSYWFETDQRLLSGNYATNLNIFNPVYGQAKPALSTTVWNRTETQQNNALFLQDHLSIGKNWKTLIGARYDSYSQKMDDRQNNRITKQSDDVISPRAGITWLPTETFSVYSSYSHSFRPNAGFDKQLNTFDPEIGRASEIGIKHESKDGRLGASLALFNIQKRNVLRLDPTDTNEVFMLNGGKASSRGIEFDISGQATSSLRLSASATYQHARVDESQAFASGSPLLNIPKFTGSLLAVKEFDLDRFGVLGIGGGLIYMDDRTGNNAGTLNLPDYTTYKALSYWQPTDKIRVTLDIENLFDTEFYAASISQNIVQPGAARTVMLGVELSF